LKKRSSNHSHNPTGGACAWNWAR